VSDALSTSPVRVTLFEDRAEVQRRGVVSVASGASWLLFSGVTPFIDERSVQVRLSGVAGQVTSVRVKRRIFHEQTLGKGELDALEADLRRAERHLAEASDAAERSQARGARVMELLSRYAAGLTSVPTGVGGPPRTGEWRAAYDALLREEAAVLAAASDARLARDRAQHEVAQAETRLREGTTRHVRQEALVEVRVEAEAAGEAVFDIVYRTPGAMWRPEYVAHVKRVEGGDQLSLMSWGTIWQRTGEDWRDVEVCLSTARPAAHATAPLLTDDVLVSRRKVEEEVLRRRTVVEGREQAIARAHVAGAVSAVEQMPGVDDGGVPLLHVAPARAHLVSDGRPARIEMTRTVLPTRVERVVYPELSPVAHLRALTTLSQGGPLLAGPVHVSYEGTAAGRSRTRFVAKGDTFELGLGVDDGVRVRRLVEREDEKAAILGTQRRRRTVTLWLSNLSRERKRVRLVERVPVSEIEGLEVEVLSRGFDVDARDGFASCDVDLAPDATQKLTLIYELRAESKIVLPEL
jgi:uncharacterized protein (TIGR02231 family)